MISSFLQAQNLNELVQQSSLIVEAEAVHSRSFWADGDGQDFGRNIWTETTFTVKTRFKGTTDVFSIVTLGGRVGDEVAHVSHGLSIGAGWKGLLFLTPAHTEAERMHGLPGTYRVNQLATYYYDILNPPTVFLGKAVEYIEHDILQEIERAIGKKRVVLDPAFTRKGPRKPKAPKPDKPKPTGQLKIDSLPVITYTIANPQITGNGPFNFEFDLKAHADWDSTRCAKGELWVKYNTGAFGANVAGSGSLLWTEHAFLASGDYTLTAEDKAPNLLKFTIDYTGNLGQALLNQLPTQPEPFIHIKLPVYDFMQLADIEFKSDSMQEKSKFRADGLVKYETVIAQDVQVPMAAGALDQALYFTLANMNVVQDGNGDHWFETDILARCSQDSAFTPFSKICLNYDVNVFANMAFSDNYQIIKAGLSDNPNLDLQDFFSNPAIGLMGIQVYDSIHGPVSPTGYPPDALYIHADARLLCKLRMKIANCNAPANVVFNNPLMESNSAFYAQVPTGWNYFFFDPIEGTNSFSAVVCPDSMPVIYSFSPKSITAGTLDTLTILGANLGETAGEVWFRSAEDMQNTLYLKAGEQYKRVWSDTLIRYFVPSAQLIGNTSKNMSAGTGEFYLITSSGDSLGTNGETLLVRYSNLNYITSSVARRRTILVNQDSILNPASSSGGYVFKVNQALMNDPMALNCVEAALRKWRCETGVNLTLDLSSQHNATEIDAINTIRKLSHDEFVTFPNSSVNLVARTYGNPLDCYDVEIEDLLGLLGSVSDIDIIYDGSINWFKDTVAVNISAQQSDFYSVLIHEMGHATQLGHTLNAGDVMMPVIPNATIRRNLTVNDKEGGNQIVDISTINHANFPNAQCLTPLWLSSDYCTPPEGLSHVDGISGIEIYPNPNGGTFYIQNVMSGPRSKCSIVDLTGRVVWSWSKTVENQIRIDAPPGIYFIQVSNEVESQSGLFVIIK